MRILLGFFLKLTFITGLLVFITNMIYPNTLENDKMFVDPSGFDINYSIEPFYDLHTIRFIVVLEFQGNQIGESSITLPIENGNGNKNKLAGIKYLKAISENTTIIDSDNPEIKILKYPPGTNVKIYYQVEETRKEDIELGNQYMVVLNKQYFHFLAESFFILPNFDIRYVYTFRLAWNHMPSTWNLANSFGINQKLQTVKLTLDNFEKSTFAGGDFRILKRNINNNPVYLAIRGNWLFSDNQLGDFFKQIIETERKFWNDFDYPYFLITVLPIEGSGSQDGILRLNSFCLFLSNDMTIDFRLKQKLTDQTFHNWLGNKIRISQPEQLLYWFRDGFSNYYSRLLLLRSSLITIDDYVNDYNVLLREFYTSSVRFEKNEQLINDYENNPSLERLPLLRGNVIAHNLNTAIDKTSKGKKCLDDMMKEILWRCSEESLIVSTGSLNAMIRYYAGEPALAEIMRSLNSGIPLKANPDALGSCFNMRIDSYKQFWLIGEQYNVPVYEFKNETASVDKSCMDWFLAR